MVEVESNRVCCHRCTRWHDFISNVRVQHFVGDRIFRGQRDGAWPLSSAWERYLNRMRRGDKARNIRAVFSGDSYEWLRDSYLARFKDFAVGLPTIDARNLSEKNDWWALGRHHGLTTPLLDWTRSPYIAAYFAMIDYAEMLNPGFRTGTHMGGTTFGGDYVAVWELVLDDSLQMPNEFEVFVSRPNFGYRQKAQQGLFSRLDHSIHLDVEAYLTSRGLAHLLTKYEIYGNDMGTALSDLALMNITPATMSPDLDGAAAMGNLGSLLADLAPFPEADG